MSVQYPRNPQRERDEAWARQHGLRERSWDEQNEIQEREQLPLPAERLIPSLFPNGYVPDDRPTYGD